MLNTMSQVITAVQKARPSHVGNTACHPHLMDIQTLAALNWYCTPAVAFHERNARTVPLNGCLHTAHVDRDGAHLTQATR